jgi:DNA-binding NtrC family response regulator
MAHGLRHGERGSLPLRAHPRTSLLLLDLMSKLWIVHRNSPHRDSYARLCGLAHSEIIAGAPSDEDFLGAREPAAILLGLEGDFEAELDFAHRHRARLAGARWLLVCADTDVAEAKRLFAATNPEILEVPPTARTLRAFVSAAIAQRSAASLTERQHRQRIAERFSSWLGGIEVPGLLRALDPSLQDLPLLVRGRPGSGRSLLCHYVDLFRGAPGPILRIHGRDLDDPEELVRRIAAASDRDQAPIRSIWVDEIDVLSISAQNTLAEWIVHGSAPAAVAFSQLRWIATAGAAGFRDRLEPSLERAFAPLRIDVPALVDHPAAVGAFAEEVARDWTRSIGGGPRRFADSAIAALKGNPWSGDRTELEAVLRTSLAASGREVLEDVDLRFSPVADPSDSADTAKSRHVASSPEAVESIEQLAGLPVVEATPETGIDLDALENAFIETPPAEDPQPPSTVDPDESIELSEATFAIANDETRTTAPAPASDVGGHDSWRRLARSLSHEIRNPLVSIRTFAELLPDHFEDETFRARFTELVGRDVNHISDVLSRLSSVAERENPVAEPLDVSALIEHLLEERRERIANGRLLVLRELEREAPIALVDGPGLRVALAGLLDRALESLPERGDLFVATRRLQHGPDGEPRLRVLLRHHNPPRGGENQDVLAELDPVQNVLEYVLAETIIEAAGGTLTIDSSDARETLILLDLRTPS